MSGSSAGHAELTESCRTVRLSQFHHRLPGRPSEHSLPIREGPHEETQEEARKEEDLSRCDVIRRVEPKQARVVLDQRFDPSSCLATAPRQQVVLITTAARARGASPSMPSAMSFAVMPFLEVAQDRGHHVLRLPCSFRGRLATRHGPRRAESCSYGSAQPRLTDFTLWRRGPNLTDQSAE